MSWNFAASDLTTKEARFIEKLEDSNRFKAQAQLGLLLHRKATQKNKVFSFSSASKTDTHDSDQNERGTYKPADIYFQSATKKDMPERIKLLTITKQKIDEEGPRV